MLLRALILFGLFAAILPGSAQAERRVALVIGNSAYASAASLRNPRNDASDFAEKLKTLGFEVELGLDLDQQGFARSIESFARTLDGADVGLFYYAGHGLQLNDKNYLVSANAKLDSEFMLPSETIELDAIVRLMESKAPINLVFLDACRNNPLTENLKRSMVALKRSAALGRGLARVEPSGRDTLIAFSAAPGQEANDGVERNSPFTAALLQHVTQPGLEVSVMLKEVAADVRRDTRNSQRPQQLSDMTRPFYFVKAETAVVAKAEPAATPELMTKPAPQPAPQAAERPADDRTLDVAFWNAAQAANECEAVRAYMRRFPNGVFVDLAKLSERRLCNPNRTVAVVDAPAPEQKAAITPALTAPPVSPPPAPSSGAPPSAATLPAPKLVPTTMATLPSPAAVAPPSGKPAGSTPTELARVIQIELYRLGCTTETDEKWSAATREGLRRFNQAARATLDLENPSDVTVAALQKQPDRVCPLQCAHGMQARGDTCVAMKHEPKKQRRRHAPAEEAYAPAAAPPPVAAGPMMGPPMGFGFGGGMFFRRH